LTAGVGGIDGIAKDVAMEARVSAAEPDQILARPPPDLRIVVAGAEAGEAGLGVVDPARKPEGLIPFVMS